MKTERLFNYYTSIFNEEVDGGSPDATDVAEVPAEAMAAETDEMTSEGEKYLVELLVKAFLHEPDESGAATAKQLQGEIELDPKGVASAISNLVELGNGEMKETLAL